MTVNDAVKEVLARYREAAIGAATFATSNPNESYKWAKTLIRCYRTLCDSVEGKNGIIALMSDDNPYVRGIAASHSLQWVPDEARVVLEALLHDDGPGAFEAKWTLIEYDEGNLKFD